MHEWFEFHPDTGMLEVALLHRKERKGFNESWKVNETSDAQSSERPATGKGKKAEKGANAEKDGAIEKDGAVEKVEKAETAKTSGKGGARHNRRTRSRGRRHQPRRTKMMVLPTSSRGRMCLRSRKHWTKRLHLATIAKG